MGGGGGGNQSVTQEFKPPEWTVDGWKQSVQAGQAISQTPYQQSGLPTVAPINDYQDTAMQLMYDKALYGTPMSNSANGAFINAAQGNYANPYAQNVMGIASGQAYNPALEGYFGLANSGPNPYTSDEYTNNMIQRQADTMAQGFANGTAAQNDAAAAMAGAFGGSGHEEKQRADAGALSQQIGNMASQTLAQQQQYKGNMYNADFANQMQALGGYSNAYMGDVQNQLNANQQAGGMWQQDIGNILQGAVGGLNGDAAYNVDMQGLMGAGNSRNAYYQKLLDSYNNQWNTQSMYDATMNDYLQSVLGRASGSWGQSATTQPGGNNLAGLLSLGAAGAGAYSLFSGG